MIASAGAQASSLRFRQIVQIIRIARAAKIVAPTVRTTTTAAGTRPWSHRTPRSIGPSRARANDAAILEFSAATRRGGIGKVQDHLGDEGCGSPGRLRKLRCSADDGERPIASGQEHSPRRTDLALPRTQRHGRTTSAAEGHQRRSLSWGRTICVARFVCHGVERGKQSR